MCEQETEGGENCMMMWWARHVACMGDMLYVRILNRRSKSENARADKSVTLK
jgi:hypothetical protein